MTEAEITAYLADHPTAFDLIASADTLLYFGDLCQVLAAAAGALRPGGQLLFSVELLPPESEADYLLTSSGRYAHAERYVRDALTLTGLEITACDREVLRRESGEPVHGLLLDASKPGDRLNG